MIPYKAFNDFLFTNNVTYLYMYVYIKQRKKQKQRCILSHPLIAKKMEAKQTICHLVNINMYYTELLSGEKITICT